MSERTNQQRLIADLRAIADFYEANPDCPCEAAPVALCAYVSNREQLDAAARAFGTFEKEASEFHFSLTKKFGGYAVLIVSTERTNVCTRRKVGQKTVPSHYVPERTTDVYEYDCPEYLLAKEPAADA